MFHCLEKVGISKAVAEKKMVAIGVDEASVNMGRYKGLKALIQNNPSAPGSDSCTGDGGGFVHSLWEPFVRAWSW